MNSVEPTSRVAGTALVDPAKQSMLLAALYIAQEQQGYLTDEAIQRVARRLGLRPGERGFAAGRYTLAVVARPEGAAAETLALDFEVTHPH